MIVFGAILNVASLLLVAIPVVIIILLLAFVVIRKRPKKLKLDHFQNKWVELQKMCGSKDTWPSAVLNADKLLDEALKKRKMGGKNMGERLVKAQRIFTDNDAVWFGHKLRNRVEGDPSAKLKEGEVKEALIGIRQALKDLGALPK